MTRARCVLGPSDLHQRYYAVRQAVITASHDLPGLQDNVGNIALPQRAETAGLLRKVQHHARLNAPTQVAPEALQAERDAVLALWHAVFG